MPQPAATPHAPLDNNPKTPFEKPVKISRQAAKARKTVPNTTVKIPKTKRNRMSQTHIRFTYAFGRPGFGAASSASVVLAVTNEIIEVVWAHASKTDVVVFVVSTVIRFMMTLRLAAYLFDEKLPVHGLTLALFCRAEALTLRSCVPFTLSGHERHKCSAAFGAFRHRVFSR